MQSSRWVTALAAVVSFMSAAGPAAAGAVPPIMNFQGILLDSTDAPVKDSTWGLAFRIYSANVGGSVLWSEDQLVSTRSGLFNTFLGQQTALPDSVFDSPDRWLELKLDVYPLPYEPRTQLGSVGYAYRVNSVDGAKGGSVSGVLTVDSLNVGSPALSGLLRLYRNGSGDPVIRMENRPMTYGGSVRVYDELGSITNQMEVDVNNEGGYLGVYRGPGLPGFTVDGNYTASNEPKVTISGSARSVIFEPGEAGDLSVRLPDDAIAAAEILDEPGISARDNTIPVTLSSTMQDLVVCTLSTPSSGYIVVQGTATFCSYGMYQKAHACVQIDESSGGGEDAAHSVLVGLDSVSVLHDTAYFSVAVQRVYFKSAGTYPFRVEARRHAGSTAGVMDNSSIIAVFYPTSYGTVSTLVTAAEAAQFDNAVPAEVAGGTASSERHYRVDLRELEVKAARARAQAERLERELVEAQIRQQIDGARPHEER